jgi:archaellum biogenesis protein FlaJ (TadC family)
MNESKVSIIVELKDKFSASVKALEGSFASAKIKADTFKQGLSRLSNEFFTGGKELEKFKSELKDVGSVYQETLKMMGGGLTFNKVKG